MICEIRIIQGILMNLDANIQRIFLGYPVILYLQRTRGKCLEELWPLPTF